MNGNETDWVALAKTGDRSAMRELYERHRSRIYTLAYRYTGNGADAEDILQDSFIKAFSSLQKCDLNENSYFSTWLYRIAVNCALDHFRRRRHRDTVEWNEKTAASASTDAAPTPEDGIPPQRDAAPGAAQPGKAQRPQTHGRRPAPLSAVEDQ